MPKAGGRLSPVEQPRKSAELERIGMDRKDASDAERIAREPEILDRVINETVLTVRDYLVAKDQKAHIGKDEILTFLGTNWNAKTIQDALATIRDEEIDREAVEGLD